MIPKGQQSVLTNKRWTKKKSMSFNTEQDLALTPCVGHRMNYLGLPQVLSSTREHRHVYAATDLERFKQAENNIRVGGAQGLKKGRKP